MGSTLCSSNYYLLLCFESLYRRFSLRSDSLKVASDSAQSVNVDLSASNVRVVFDAYSVLTMVGAKLLDGKYGDLFVWQRGCDYKVAPMLTVGTNVLLASRTKHRYAEEFVFPVGMVERYVSSRTFQYVRARLSVDWYLSGRVYSDSFVFSLEGNLRSLSERHAQSSSPLSIGASAGYRWFWQNGFTVETTLGADTYKGDESAQSAYLRVMLGYVF